MDKNTLKNGIAGAVIGAGLLTGVGYNPADIDPLTNLPYSEVVNNPGTDVYYTPLTSDVTTAMNNGSMSKLPTARYSLDGSRVIIKYNAGEIDRRLSPARLGTPYTKEEILVFISNPENGFISEVGID